MPRIRWGLYLAWGLWGDRVRKGAEKASLVPALVFPSLHTPILLCLYDEMQQKP